MQTAYYLFYLFIFNLHKFANLMKKKSLKLLHFGTGSYFKLDLKFKFLSLLIIFIIWCQWFCSVCPVSRNSCLLLFLADNLPVKHGPQRFPRLPHQVKGDNHPETVEEHQVNPEMKEVVCA